MAGALHYYAPPPSHGRKDSEYWRWWRYRMLLRFGFVALFCVIAFYFGPNLINFGKLTSLSPSDFRDDVKNTGVPIVRAVLVYQRDKGTWPIDVEDAMPVKGKSRDAMIMNGQIIFFSKWNHRISYNPNANPATWEVEGPFTSGVIPAPPVVLPPATQPGSSR